jgi:hypothetical protein
VTPETNANLMKWAGFAVCVAAAAVAAFYVHDYDRAAAYVSTGLMIVGVSQRLGAKVERVQADVAAIRDDPLMPGPPLTPAERVDRGLGPTDVKAPTK